jgi:hypothetical protein
VTGGAARVLSGYVGTSCRLGPGGFHGFCMAAAVCWSLFGPPKTLLGLKALVGWQDMWHEAPTSFVSSSGPHGGIHSNMGKCGRGAWRGSATRNSAWCRGLPN